MTTRLTTVVVALTIAMTGRDAHAQWNAARFDERAHDMSVVAGIDPATMATLAYHQRVPIGGLGVRFGIEGSLIAGSHDLHDYQLRLGAESVVLRWQSVRATGRLGFDTRGTANQIHRAFGFGADVGGTLGIYRRHWFAGAEASFDKAIITHLTHTDWYRTYYYPDAKDGWYLDAGGTWRTGAVVGTSFGRNEIVLRAGVPRTQGGRALVAPAYATLGVGRAF